MNSYSEKISFNYHWCMKYEDISVYSSYNNNTSHSETQHYNQATDKCTLLSGIRVKAKYIKTLEKLFTHKNVINLKQYDLTESFDFCVDDEHQNVQV